MTALVFLACCITGWFVSKPFRAIAHAFGL